MLVSQVYFYGAKHAFHLYLLVNDKGENILASSIPRELLQKHFPSTYATLQFGYFPNAFSADRYLNIMADCILSRRLFKQFFYPDYLLNSGRASFETAEALIKLIDSFPLYSRTYYCKSNCPLLFWTLTMKYNRMKRYVLRTGIQIQKMEFEDFLMNEMMEQDYFHISNKSDIHLMLTEYGQPEYLLVLSENHELKFFIAL